MNEDQDKELLVIKMNTNKSVKAIQITCEFLILKWGKLIRVLEIIIFKAIPAGLTSLDLNWEEM